MGKKLLQLVLALAVIGLGFYVYVLISTPIKFAEEQKIREKAVITRIKDIRTAERQFKSSISTLLQTLTHSSTSFSTRQWRVSVKLLTRTTQLQWLV